MSSVEPLVSLVCASSQMVFRSGESGQVWRIAEGVVRLDRGDGPTRQPVQIAVPGDLIGTEMLCDQPYRFSATALTPCRLERVDVQSAEARESLLRVALMQQQARCQDMTALRTGPVRQRITYFLGLLGWDGSLALRQKHPAEIRKALPTLREVAQVIDAKTETVCRALAQLLPRAVAGAASGGASSQFAVSHSA